MNHKIKNIQLFSVPSDYGHGANDGAYYPVGLLSIGSHLNRVLPHINVSIVDRHHDNMTNANASVVGISASSTLNYRNVLQCAIEAKKNGSIVVLGGPHATQLASQIMRNQVGIVDFIIRGNGEVPFEKLIYALINNFSFERIQNLSWRNQFGEVIHNPLSNSIWKYDDYLPLNFSLLRNNIEYYWKAFRNKIDSSIDAAFVVFTHFGCGYREMMVKAKQKNHHASWCSYCSLNDSLFARDPQNIINETLALIKANQLSKGANILLKCYGDNIGTHINLLEKLKDQIRESKEWNDYNIVWTFYCQSSRVSKRSIEILSLIKTQNLYIGFDSVDDEIQKLNGLGTSKKNHIQATLLCKENGIKIQAGFVLGCIGETINSINETLSFAEEMSKQKLLERINSAVLFIIPGSPAYEKLCEKEPWIKDMDILNTDELQFYWVKHFCPALAIASDPHYGIRILKDAANYLDELSPGPHASMGFISNRFQSKIVLAENLESMSL